MLNSQLFIKLMSNDPLTFRLLKFRFSGHSDTFSCEDNGFIGILSAWAKLSPPSGDTITVGSQLMPSAGSIVILNTEADVFEKSIVRKSKSETKY